MSTAHNFPKLPRFDNLIERIGIIIERNPAAFATPVAEKLTAPVVIVPDEKFKPVDEHGGEIAARLLLEWDANANRLVVFTGSFVAEDEREPPEDLDSPTILAWRLLEDLCFAADMIEDDLIESGAWEPPREPESVKAMAAMVDELLAANPQFFPPWLTEKLELGVQVIEAELESDPDALGLFDYDPQTGSRIFIVHPNMLDEVSGLGAPTMARELLITLCHEYEHHYGNVRGRDPLGNREWYFDRHWLV